MSASSIDQRQSAFLGHKKQKLESDSVNQIALSSDDSYLSIPPVIATPSIPKKSLCGRFNDYTSKVLPSKAVEVVRPLFSAVSPRRLALMGKKAAEKFLKHRSSPQVSAPFEKVIVDVKKAIQGRQVNPDGSIYEGEFVDGKMTGQGKLTYSNRYIFEGSFIDGKITGKGKITYLSLGVAFEGDFIESTRFGLGKYISFDGELLAQGFFYRDHFQTDSSNFADFNFVRGVIGHSEFVGLAEYFMSILSDYLIENGHAEFGAALKEANEIYQLDLSELEQKASSVYQKLTKDSLPQLLYYGIETHSIGLNIVPDVLSGFVIFEIFNSGEGLIHFHKRSDFNRRKFQTMLKVRAPMSSLTLEKIQELMRSENFKDVKDAYDKILSLQDCEILRDDSQSATFQSSQRKRTCSSRWIFVYLRNKMPKEEYDRMRMGLFQALIPHHKHPESKEIVSILEKKIEKRKTRLGLPAAGVSESVPSSTNPKKTTYASLVAASIELSSNQKPV